MIQTSFNPISSGATGMFGGQVVKYVRHGRVIIAKAPRKRPGKGTPGQERTRADFQLAAGWSRRVRSTPALKEYYDVAVGDGKNVHNLAIGDCLVAPEIHDVYVEDGCIHVKATDNFKVAMVTVSIYAPDGELLEAGLAADEGDTWTYKPGVAVHTGCTVVAIARDLPGNECRSEIFIPENEQPVITLKNERVLRSRKIRTTDTNTG